MKPLHKSYWGFILIIGFSLSTLTGETQSLTGDYSLQSGEVTLTLKLNQQGNTISGTLSGNTGASFQLSGEAEANVAYGTCSGAEGTVFFEVFAEGDDLTLSLIEPDIYGAPDYNQAQYLQFKKKKSVPGTTESTATGAVTGALGLGGGGESQTAYQNQANDQYGPTGSQGQGISGYQSQSATGYQSNAAAGTAGTPTIAENEVGDASWGLKFGLPEGWVRRNTAQGAVVGHNTIPGMVLVIPHMATSMQEMWSEMMKGMQEEGSYLMPEGSQLEQLNQNVITGDYSGMADGTQVKAKGYGVLSPGGGGAYLIALSKPHLLGPELLGAASSMLESVQFFKVDNSELIRHFAGNWANHTSHTSTWLSFGPDGSFSEQYEASYSGSFNDGAGNYTGDWNAMSQDSDRGRWTVRGNKDSGTIVVRLANGNEVTYEYRVHIEDGHKYYREYYFNGYLYSKKD